MSQDYENQSEFPQEQTGEEIVRQEKAVRRKDDKGADIGKTMLFFLHDLVYLLSAFLLVLLILFRIVVVSGPSMKDTLIDGDTLLVLSSTFYRNPEYGDIVIVTKEPFQDGTPIIKRVIATENQYVDIDFEEGIVYVGDSQDSMQPLKEPYTRTPTNMREGMTFPLQVPEGCVFVMGDNRNESKDSRSPEIGIVDSREIIGKAFLLVFPGTDGGKTDRDFGRIGVLN